MLVVIESPFGTRPDGTRASPDEVARNVRYLDAAINDCLARGEDPYASHGFFPGRLDDSIPDQRERGIRAGFAWGEKAERRVFYTDLGWTSGMQRGKGEAERLGQSMECRTIPGWR